MIGLRRKARIAALQTLYEINCASHHRSEEVLAHLLEEKNLPEETASFAQKLIHGVLQNKGELDSTIQKFALAFPVEQIATIDRNILRLAIFEILVDNKVPVKVAINEAVELAKAFGSDTSPKFINGVLGAVATTVAMEKRT